MRNRIGTRGISIIATLIATLIVVSALTFGLSALLGGKQATRKMEIKTVAENYAAELLESFLVFNSGQLAGFISRDPAYAQPTALVPAYPLCAHVNILDRAATPANGPPTILNPDPIAALPLNLPFGNLSLPKYLPNRFYQITVVDPTNLAVNNNACGRFVDPNPPCGVRPGGRYSICPNERFLVAVGVSFVPAGKTEAEVERVVFTALVDP